MYIISPYFMLFPRVFNSTPGRIRPKWLRPWSTRPCKCLVIEHGAQQRMITFCLGWDGLHGPVRTSATHCASKETLRQLTTFHKVPIHSISKGPSVAWFHQTLSVQETNLSGKFSSFDLRQMTKNESGGNHAVNYFFAKAIEKYCSRMR